MRLIAALLLHMHLEPKLRQFLTLLKYCNNYSGEYLSPLAAYTLALMMLSVSIMAESMNLYLVSGIIEIVKCIIKPLALSIIAWSSETPTMSQFLCLRTS